MKTPQLFYMAENEGLLPTRLGKLNAAIKEIKNYPAPTIDEDTFVYIMDKCNLDYKSLTQKELNYILAEIRK